MPAPYSGFRHNYEQDSRPVEPNTILEISKMEFLLSTSTITETRPDPHPSPAKARVLQLDFLRGIAILLVIAGHRVLSSEGAGPFRPFVNCLYRIGWSGVDLFFVLSGFLIGGLLFKEVYTRGSLDVGRFIVRRLFKIWPSYYVYLALLALGIAFTSLPLIDYAGAPRSLIPNLLHIQNYTGARRSHTWSLSVEEHFYLFLPLLLLAVLPRRRSEISSIPAIPIVAGIVMVSCLALRVLTFKLHGRLPDDQFNVTYLYPTHLRIDSLFFGVLLAYLNQFHPHILAPVRRNPLVAILLGLALVSPMVLFQLTRVPFVYTFGFTVLYLGYGAILMGLVYTPLQSGKIGQALQSLPGRAVAFIGFYSYPIYLWHVDGARMPMDWMVKQGLFNPVPGPLRWLIVLILYTALATLVGVIMGRLVEKPALAVRDRLFPARTEPVYTKG